MTAQSNKTRTRFTLGPLNYRRDRDGCDDTWDIYHAADGGVITSVPFWDCDPEWMAKAEATARLFASSPELLKALECLLSAGPNGNANRYNTAVNRARAAIAKAKGTK